MRTDKSKRKFKKLSYISLLSALLVCLGACAGAADTASADMTAPSDVPTGTAQSNVEEEYIDSFIFIGESTTYHLKSRGVLRDGRDTTQVWAPKGGTATLDASAVGMNIVYPETGEEMTIGEAARLKKPRRVLFTFGLNGATEKIKRGEEYFKACYLSLINSVRDNSPQTELIIQSCFPIAESMDVSAYSVDAATLNGYIDRINGWAEELARDEGLGYVNTAEAMKNKKGFLREELHVGDGYHLTADAYRLMLEYIQARRKENR